MPVNIWNQLQDSNRSPYKYVKYAGLASIGIGCYFMAHFIPFNDCYQYTDIDQASNSCYSLRIISVFTIMFLCFIGLLVALLCCGGCCYLCMSCISNAENARQHSINMDFASNYLRNYIPTMPTGDTTCSVCALEVSEDRTKPWTELSCKHKFHIECITTWFQYKRNCPNCRAEVTLPTHSNGMIV